MAQRVFEIDLQTRNDLAIFPKYVDEHSVMALFSKVGTIGGRDKLDEIFKNPLTDADEIEQRVDAIKYLRDADTGFKIDKRDCDYIEFYLKQLFQPVSVSK